MSGKDPSACSLQGFEIEVAEARDFWESPRDFGSGFGAELDGEEYSVRVLEHSRDITEELQQWKGELEDETFHIPIFTPVILWATESTRMSYSAREFYEEMKEHRIQYVRLSSRVTKEKCTDVSSGDKSKSGTTYREDDEEREDEYEYEDEEEDNDDYHEGGEGEEEEEDDENEDN